MSTHTVPMGSLARYTPEAIAEKCAQEIARSAKGCKRAVTVDPQLRVAVEPVSSSAEADLVGVYTSPRIGAWVMLAAQIERDLKCELALRQRRAA